LPHSQGLVRVPMRRCASSLAVTNHGLGGRAVGPSAIRVRSRSRFAHRMDVNHTWQWGAPRRASNRRFPCKRRSSSKAALLLQSGDIVECWANQPRPPVSAGAARPRDAPRSAALDRRRDPSPFGSTWRQPGHRERRGEPLSSNPGDCLGDPAPAAIAAGRAAGTSLGCGPLAPARQPRGGTNRPLRGLHDREGPPGAPRGPSQRPASSGLWRLGRATPVLPARGRPP
jgi:hypothetical protein